MMPATSVQLTETPGRELRTVAIRFITRLALIFGFLLFICQLWFLLQGNFLAYDYPAWYNSAHNLLMGLPMYGDAKYGSAGLFLYPPVFAYPLLPLNAIPEIAGSWIWRIWSLLCLRYITGSWKATFTCFLFIPVLTEMSIDNVTFQVAAGVSFALRDRRGAYLLPALAALKFGPALVIPYLWVRRPETRRPLIVGTILFAAACIGTFALSPSSWSGYAAMMLLQGSSPLSGSQVIHLLPSGGSADFFARLVIGIVIAVAAIYLKWPALAYLVAVITCPVLAWSRFAPLVGLWVFRPGGPVAKTQIDTGQVPLTNVGIKWSG